MKRHRLVKLLIPIAVLMAVLGLVVSVPVSANSTGVSIEDADADPGQQVIVPIRIDGAADLAAVEVTLSYDSAVVGVDLVADGDMGGALTHGIDNAAGVTTMAWFTATGVTGDFVLANVTLSAVGSPCDTSDLDLEVTTATDSAGADITVTVEDGLFATTPCPVMGITVAIEDATADSGEQATVPITVTDAVDLAELELTVTHDSSVVIVASYVDGDMGGMLVPDVNNAAGVTTLTWTCSAGVTGDYLLADVTLEAVGSPCDTSALDLEVTTAADSTGAAIPATAEDGVFTIPCPPAGITVAIEDAAADAGEQATVPITVTGAVDLADLELTVTHDSSVVIVASFVEGDMGGMLTADVDNAAGVTTLTWTCSAGVTGDYLLADVTLEAVGSPCDTSELDLEVTTAADSTGAAIPATAEDGVFTIPCPPAGITVAIEDATADAGQQATVPITVTGAVDLADLELTVTHDSSVVIVASYVDGDMGGTLVPDVDNAAGVTTLTWTCSAGVTGDYLLADVTLEAVGSPCDTSALDLEVTMAADSTGAAIPATAEDGEFSITCDTAAIPGLSLWAGLGAMAMVLGLAAIRYRRAALQRMKV